MHILKQIGRFLAIVIAVLAIVLSAAGIYGTWLAHNTATDVTVKVFSVFDTAVGVAEVGVSRANSLVQSGRADVQQIETTITTVGANLEENSPVLTALSSRISSRLAPTVDQVRDFLAPAVNALRTIRNLVEIVNAIPFLRETPPGIERLDAAFNRLDETVADVRQINDTLRESVVDGKNQLTGEAVTTLTSLTTRVDDRLAEVQASVEETQAELIVLQSDLQATESRLLRIYNLTALALTLFLLWVIYSQFVVIRHQWRTLRAGGDTAHETTPLAAPLEPAPPATWVEPAPAAPPLEPAPDASPTLAESASDELEREV
jgi:tRNA threonylcarbamoyladenosine modification (KEOPS) complex Cgi121 subunit